MGSVPLESHGLCSYETKVRRFSPRKQILIDGIIGIAVIVLLSAMSIAAVTILALVASRTV